MYYIDEGCVVVYNSLTRVLLYIFPSSPSVLSVFRGVYSQLRRDRSQSVGNHGRSKSAVSPWACRNGVPSASKRRFVEDILRSTIFVCHIPDYPISFHIPVFPVLVTSRSIASFYTSLYTQSLSHPGLSHHFSHPCIPTPCHIRIYPVVIDSVPKCGGPTWSHMSSVAPGYCRSPRAMVGV